MDMDDAELEVFLESQRTLYIATVSENGWPHVAPVGFARLDNGHFYVLTHPSQRKSRNIFYDNRVGLTADAGESYTSLRGMFVHGYATVVTDDQKRPELENAWVERFYDGEIPDVVKKVYSKRDGWIWFDVEPVHTVTWDNRKLDPERLVDEDAPDGMPFSYGLPDDIGAATPDDK
ncbi:pyridoxamine 5'-phosphate oxidase-related, FMN-binding protein (plasmid) [Halalkalicoccus jeotgali B3]|uniref:Pyridoxamine 5'-phosphate oxidase-related, FMN-binding protein n=2 Tax=Halalkalicoccus jeotgali TaxID=413810 RepID=D8JCX1_HALJB|nr:pyridoxamine 5'-phosphate oxidase-related, FMN-binding protein [Halalkalicoccus jeotgali B3]